MRGYNEHTLHNKPILDNPDSPDVPRLEKEIDKLVYDLYDLTPEEIAIVEGKKILNNRHIK